jgi:hypothetical protein
MSVNKYVTKFTQLSHYASHEIDTDEKKQECFFNGLNDGLAYALEARDFENFQGMVNNALVLGNRKGVMERKPKLVRQHQPGSSSRPRVATSSAGAVLCPAQPHFQPRPQTARQVLSTPQCQVIQRPNNLQTPAARNHNVQRTQATQDPQQADGRCHNYGEKGHYANRCPNLHTRANQPAIPMDLALFLLLSSRTMPVGESIMWPWKKHKKLVMLSLVCFSSTTHLQLCCLIPAHRILSYLLHMLGSIIYPWLC